MVKLTLLRKQNSTWAFQVLSFSFPSSHLTDSQIKLLISASIFFISICLFYKFASSLVLFCSFIKVSIPLKIVSIILNSYFILLKIVQYLQHLGFDFPILCF